ncbi:MAG TPA: DNA-formamidopyrimidine glycosylase family protein [Actinomycetota bacterium]
MAELPEVETLRHDLDKEIVGRKIRDVEVAASRVVRRHRNRPDFCRQLSARRVAAIGRSGPHLLIGLDSGDTLVLTLGASGRLLRERSAAPVERHTNAVITFATGGGLRVLGLAADGELFVLGAGDRDGLAALGHAALDPLADAVAWPSFGAMVTAGRGPLRALLTGGALLAGVGPIYADEILWASGLRFDHDAGSLRAQEVRRLHRAVQEILQEAVRLRGSSVGDDPWLDLHGNKGEYQERLRAYQREGQPCQRCRSPLVAERLAHGDAQSDADSDAQIGDVTYYCPRCQS